MVDKLLQFYYYAGTKMILAIETNPWVILGGKDDSANKANEVTKGTVASLWKLLKNVGLVGAILSILILAVVLGVTKNSEKRQQAKEGIVKKLIVVVLISGFATIIGWIGTIIGSFT